MCRNLSNVRVFYNFLKVGFFAFMHIFLDEFDYLNIFYRKAGRTKHLKVCKEIGTYERSDIVAFVCPDCSYIAKSSRGLTQHRVQGSNCQERTFSKTMSRLELSITNGDSNVALEQTSSGLSCCG